jgi:hypothetical protein
MAFYFRFLSLLLLFHCDVSIIREANTYSIGEEILCHFWNTEVHYLVQNSPLLNLIPCQMIQSAVSYPISLRFVLILFYFLPRFHEFSSHQVSQINSVRFSYFSLACYVNRISHSTSYDRPNNVW